MMVAEIQFFKLSIIDNDTISSLGASTIPLIPFDDLPLKILNFFDINLMHLPSRVLKMTS